MEVPGGPEVGSLAHSSGIDETGAVLVEGADVATGAGWDVGNGGIAIGRKIPKPRTA
jgi:hypothetical protein